MSDNKFICKHDSLKRSCQICYLESEIESLKAITELAVKGLMDICSNEFTNSIAIRISRSTLSEIERLQNEQT